MFKSVSGSWKHNVCSNIFNEMNVIKFQIKIDTISMTIIFFLLSNEGSQVIFKILGNW